MQLPSSVACRRDALLALPSSGSFGYHRRLMVPTRYAHLWDTDALGMLQTDADSVTLGRHVASCKSSGCGQPPVALPYGDSVIQKHELERATDAKANAVTAAPFARTLLLSATRSWETHLVDVPNEPARPPAPWRAMAKIDAATNTQRGNIVAQHTKHNM